MSLLLLGAGRGASAAPLSISGTAPSQLEPNEAWAGVTFTASGGTPPYSYSLVGGSIAGLSVNSSTGLFDGTPTGVGTRYSARKIRVTDAAAATADHDFDLVVRFARDLTPPDPWARDTVDGITSWHTDSIGRAVVSTVERMTVGYAKNIGATGDQGGNQGIAESWPQSGELVTARIVRTGIESENDHNSPAAHQIVNGTHAGKLWGWASPHSTATVVDPGDVGRYDWYCSLTGRVDDLYRVGFTVFSGQHNYGQYAERSDGRITLTIVNDAGSPQSAHTVWTDSPESVPVKGRACYDMTGATGGTASGTPQLYVNSVPGLTTDTLVDYLFIHPSCSEQPVKRATRNLSTGQVLNAGTPVSGDFYDTAGGTMLPYNTATAAIYTPATGYSFRVQDVCQSGYYAGGFAIVGVLQDPLNADATATHYLLYCDPANDPNNSSNWTALQIGLTGEAGPRFYVNPSIYTRGISFVWTSTGVRIVRVRLAATSVYQVEEWYGATGAALALERSSGSEQRTPEPTRVHAPKFSANVRYLVDRVDDYTSFTNITSSGKVLAHMRGTGIESPLCSVRPKVTGGTAQGDTLTCDGGTWLGTPAPSLAYQWFRVPDITLPPYRWTAISGATSSTYARQAGDNILACRVTGTSTNGGSAEYSDPTAPQGGNALWTPASISGLVWHLFDAREGMTSFDGDIETFAAAAGTAASYTQSTSGERPYSSLYNRRHVKFRPTGHSTGTRRLTGDSTVNAIYQNRSAFGALIFCNSNNANSQNRAVMSHATGASSTQARLQIRQNTSNNWEANFRREDGGTVSTIGTTPVTVGSDVMLTAWANMDAVSSGATNFAINAGTPATGTLSTGALTSNTASLAARFGADGSSGGAANWNGRMYACLHFAKNSGTFSTDEIQRLEGWLAHSLRLSALLPGGHPYKSAVPLV